MADEQYRPARGEDGNAGRTEAVSHALAIVYFGQRLPDYRLRGEIQDLHGRVYLICEAKHE